MYRMFASEHFFAELLTEYYEENAVTGMTLS